MPLTAELSLYPLREDYAAVVLAFIEMLARDQGLTVRTNPTSTHLSGDYDAVMDTVREALRESHARYGAQVLVCKFLPMALDD